MSLPILNCDGCGICCRNQPLPPMYVNYFYDHLSLLTLEEVMWIDTLPDDAAEELAQAVHAVVENPGLYETAACFWLDPVTLKCRHYDHRPQVCRDFEMGGSDCQRMREDTTGEGK